MGLSACALTANTSQTQHRRTKQPSRGGYRYSSNLTDNAVNHTTSLIAVGSTRVGCIDSEYVTIAHAGEGSFAASFVAYAAGIYRLRFRAEGRTRDGHSFTRERRMSASTFLGRHGGDADASSMGEREKRLCELLECLLSERVIDSRLREKLRESGFDVEYARKCVARYCAEAKRKVLTEAPREAASSAVLPSLSKLLARQLVAVDAMNLLRAPAVAVPIDPSAIPRRDRTEAELKAAETHVWSPMKPSKEEIMKRVRKNVKIDKKKKGK